MRLYAKIFQFTNGIHGYQIDSQLFSFFHYVKPIHPFIAVVDLANVNQSRRDPLVIIVWIYGLRIFS
jgi:hypothetical protein